MKNTLPILLMLLTIILVFSCKPKAEAENKDSIVNSDSTSEAITIEEIITETDQADREPTDDEIREFGLIKSIEDGAYPMFIIGVNFPDRAMKVDFNLNIEAISLDVSALSSLQGKYVSLYYLSELKNSLHDIQFNEASLLGEYAPEFDSGWKQITGVLSGAGAETASDLPDLITVTDETGKKLEFEEYISQEEVAANGKTVTVFYSIRGVQTITYLKQSGE